MAEYPPFVNAYGTLGKVLDKIKEAQTPTRFTQDFLANILGFKGGSAKSVIPLLKRIRFLGSDGVPTELYSKYRNDNTSGQAIAEGMLYAYKELAERNENFYSLTKSELKGLVLSSTGLSKDSGTVSAILGTIEVLRARAKFDAVNNEEHEE